MEVEAEVIDSFPVMTEVETLIDIGLKTGIEEDILLDPNPEDIILQEVLITGRTSKIIEVTSVSSKVTAYPNLLPGEPELHLCHPIGAMKDVVVAGNLVIFLENVLKRTLL